jgi:hypothetical protein
VSRIEHLQEAPYLFTSLALCGRIYAQVSDAGIISQYDGPMPSVTKTARHQAWHHRGSQLQ